MSRIDTGDVARFWLGGSQQGISMANSLAQQDMAERQFAFDQQRSEFGQAMDLRQMDMAERRFGMDVEEFGRQTEMDRLRIEAANEAKAQRLNTARTLASVTRRRLAQVRGARADAQASAMMMAGAQQQVSPTGELVDVGKGAGLAGMAPNANGPSGLMQGMSSGGAGAGGGGGGGGAMPAAPRAPRLEANPFTYDPAQDPAERDFERAITAAEALGDVDALEVLSDAIDDEEKRRTILEQGRQMIALAGNWEYISPKAPQLRAIARAAAMVGDFKRVFEIFEQDAEELAGMTPEQLDAAIDGLTGGKIDPERRRALVTFAATSKFSPMVVGRVMDIAMNDAGSGRVSVEVAKKNVDIARDTVKAKEAQLTGLLRSALPDPKAVADAREAVKTAKDDLTKAQNVLNGLGGMDAQESPKNLSTIMIGDREVQVDDEKAVEIGRAARDQFIRTYGREPDVGDGSADLPALIEIRDRLMRSAGAAE